MSEIDLIRLISSSKQVFPCLIIDFPYSYGKSSNLITPLIKISKIRLDYLRAFTPISLQSPTMIPILVPLTSNESVLNFNTYPMWISR